MSKSTKFVDLTGKIFGRLSVLSRQLNNKFNKIVWSCLCSCGTEKNILGDSLKAGLVKSCGCLRVERAKRIRYINHVGKRFGKLIVLERKENNRHGDFRWLCRCDCGKEKVIVAGGLVGGKTQSCGCFQRDESSRRAKLRIGDKNSGWKGGVTPEHQRIRTSTAYENWRLVVFSRDGYHCQCCSKKGGELRAHHIKSFRAFPELRLEVSNGVTVCVPCHSEIHSLEIKEHA